MNTKSLSLNTIPPILNPLRFFLTAPLFGILAAILLLYYGSDIWISRWLSSSLALTHLMTIGFMLMVMMGALYQFIPVMIGQFIPGGNKFVTIIHLSLMLGSLSLASGFIVQNSFLYGGALFFLGLSLSLFSVSLLLLMRVKLKGHLIVFLMRIFFFVLLIVIGIGLFMLLGYAYPELNIIYRQYTDSHALWGLVGWVVLLIMAVSSQVIPMFFVTPEFSVNYLKVLSLCIIVTLAIMLVSNETLWFKVGLQSGVREVLNLILSVELAFFSIYTLSLINQRKRKLPDITINFFRLSLASLLIVIGFWWSLHLWQSYPEMWGNFEHSTSQSEFIIGILLIYGLAVSAIIGMLQKIVPFLIFLNLQNLAFKHPESMSAEPKLVLNMKQVISNKQSKAQFVLHCSSYFLLILSVYWVQFVWIAGLAMLGNFVWLAYSLFKGFFLYNKNKNSILKFPETKIKFGI